VSAEAGGGVFGAVHSAVEVGGQVRRLAISLDGQLPEGNPKVCVGVCRKVQW